MSGWLKHKDGHRSRDLGHGLVLRIDPAHRGKMEVFVLGRRLVTPSTSLSEAKSRAENAARRWVQEALLKLSNSI